MFEVVDETQRWLLVTTHPIHQHHIPLVSGLHLLLGSSLNYLEIAKWNAFSVFLVGFKDVFLKEFQQVQLLLILLVKPATLAEHGTGHAESRLQLRGLHTRLVVVVVAATALVMLGHTLLVLSRRILAILYHVLQFIHDRGNLPVVRILPIHVPHPTHP